MLLLPRFSVGNVNTLFYKQPCAPLISLGSHLMGKAGRVYWEVVGESIARITGLDPAGPRFVDGPLVGAIPELNENRLR